MKLAEKIKKKQAVCGVIGLGYVGLPLVVELGKAGFKVIGVDLDERKIEAINRNKSYIGDVTDQDLKELRKNGRLSVGTDYSVLKDVDTINICVPTPLRKTRDPDISYILEACARISEVLRKDQLIILESTTYPGTTHEMMLPIFEETGLAVGKDFYLAFSPERVDPSNPVFKTKNIPKVVGGVTPACTRAASLFYEQFMDKVVPVSSARVAETVKLLENTFRSVNIGLVNEIALMCHKMNIDVWEVIDAAATKPFGFMPFYPGPGLGGHCIPIDPLYLSWKARLFGFEARFIELASQINSGMPDYVVTRVAEILNQRKKCINGSKILVIGVAYKKDVADMRESPALSVIEMLLAQGAKVRFSDPCVKEINYNSVRLKNERLDAKSLSACDCVVIITNHAGLDYRLIAASAPLILDTRNALKGIKGQARKKIHTL